MTTVKIDKLIFGGKGLGKVGGKAYFVWKALPGEEVEVNIKKNSSNFAEGIAVNILKPSKYRIKPREDHYLSCSPWQILEFKEENTWKVEIAKETYKKLGGIENKILKKLEIVTDNNEYGYRNKMEYSFGGETGKITLAFFEREGRKHIEIEKCELARPEINEVALEILSWINHHKITMRNLKTMIVRCNAKGEVLAGLFLKDRMEFSDYPEIGRNFVGLTVYYSTHKSPASVPTDILYKVGDEFLEEELNGTKLQYGLFSFFQINVPIFKDALSDIGEYVENADFVDFYSGVGSIGLSLMNIVGKGKKVELVESNAEAVEYAEKNIKLNKFTNCTTVCKPTELITELITPDKTIIFDPPRAGLDKRVVEKVLVELPKKIIYLSCDLATHARDIKLLSDKYEIKFMKLYNFFPRTAHIEALCVLEVK